MVLTARRRGELTEEMVFGWADAWLGHYVITDVGDAHVSFECLDRAGRADERSYTLPRGDMERLLEAGSLELLEPAE